MAKIKKTNAIRLLDQNNIDYNIITYDNSDGKIDGVSVAWKIGRDVESVFKTLVAQGNSKEIYVFIIPVDKELDLKKAAKSASEKKIQLIPVKDILKLTGYVRGGCSPIGMKKNYKSFIDSSAKEIEEIVVSAGKIGMQIDLSVGDLVGMIEADFADISS